MKSASTMGRPMAAATFTASKPLPPPISPATMAKASLPTAYAIAHIVSQGEDLLSVLGSVEAKGGVVGMRGRMGGFEGWGWGGAGTGEVQGGGGKRKSRQGKAMHCEEARFCSRDRATCLV